MPYIYFNFLSNNKKRLQKDKENNNEKIDDLLLYTDEELNRLNDSEEEENKVDSIFKSDVQIKAEAAPTYKAVTIKSVKLDFDEIDEKHKVIFIPSPRSATQKEDIIKKVEPSYMNSNIDVKHENEIDVYEIK